MQSRNLSLNGTTLIMANLEKLKEVRNAINNFKENFDYRAVKAVKEYVDYSKKLDSLVKHDCNTCGCIAGFTLALSEHSDSTSITIASRVLALHNSEKSFLFFADDVRVGTKNVLPYLRNYDYPKDFYYSKCSNEEGVVEALRRLDFMIEHYSKEVPT